MAAGGHFAALEEPELLIGDLRQFARLRGWKNVDRTMLVRLYY